MTPLKIDILGVDQSGCILKSFELHTATCMPLGQKIASISFILHKHIFYWLHTHQTENMKFLHIDNILYTSSAKAASA